MLLCLANELQSGVRRPVGDGILDKPVLISDELAEQEDVGLRIRIDQLQGRTHSAATDQSDHTMADVSAGLVP